MSWFGPVSVLAECPRWDTISARLTWVDIDGGTLMTGTPDGDDWAVTMTNVGAPLAGAVMTSTPGIIVCAVGESLSVLSIDGLRHLTDVEHSKATALRLNEIVTDPAGRLWVGSMAFDWSLGAGSVFRMDLDGEVRRIIRGLTISNGIGWSPDATTMYTTDTPTDTITAWDFDLDLGLPRNPRPLVVVSGVGHPDGLAVDVDGNLWSAIAGGGYVACFDPSGSEVHREPVPVPVPTSCCFTGPNLDRLMVTTSRKRLNQTTLEENPESGRVWDAGRVGAVGLPQAPFTGVVSESGR